MARDAGLRRISATTRWITAGVVALAGALSLIAANAFHGHTAGTASQTGGSTSLTPQSSNVNAIQQPSQAPQPVVQQQPVVVSGGS